jgi:prevent-host-death family protein
MELQTLFVIEADAVMTMKMKIMTAGAFKARCSQVLKKVNSTRTAVVITKRGKPIVKLVPMEAASDWVPGRSQEKSKFSGILFRQSRPSETGVM